MREAETVSFLLNDHLSSTAVTANSSGGEGGRLLYKPWGETRYSSGTTPTSYRFTGQREDVTIGLYFYNSRYYDPVLGRFSQPDTMVPEPGKPQSLNRYSYALNNPVENTDPSGHWVESALDIAFIGYDLYDINANGLTCVNSRTIMYRRCSPNVYQR
jgi:RHS repeat-associated protein